MKKKLVKLVDTTGNNPVVAKRIKKGQYYFPFPLYDKEGNEITEEQAGMRKGGTTSALESPNETKGKMSNK